MPNTKLPVCLDEIPTHDVELLDTGEGYSGTYKEKLISKRSVQEMVMRRILKTDFYLTKSGASGRLQYEAISRIDELKFLFNITDAMLDEHKKKEASR